MAASLDGYIARKDGSVGWMETSDEFVDGATMDPEFVESFLRTIDCYVMGSRTYETALGFEAKGLGWAYGDKPTFVLTTRDLPRTRESVEFYSGDSRGHRVPRHLRRVLSWTGTGVLVLRCGASLVQTVYLVAVGRVSVAAMGVWEPWCVLGAMLFVSGTWRYERRTGRPA
jgi:dihydrofolate reductase